MAVSSLPNTAFTAETLELEFRAVQPPDFWTTVRDVLWPNYPEFVGSTVTPELNPMMWATEEQHAVRLWSPGEKAGVTRQSNNQEFTIAMQVFVAWVTKCGKELQRQVFLARADLRNLLLGNMERNRPGYTGANTWGLFTLEASPMVTQFIEPGLAVTTWLVDVEIRNPMRKG